MGEVAVGVLQRTLPHFNGGEYWKGKGKAQLLLLTPKCQCQCRMWSSVESKPHPLKINNNHHHTAKPATYSSKMTTKIPLYESPGASFDQYLESKPRVFRAIFPDKRRSQQLNEEEWRIHMLPIQFLFVTVWPVIDMRLRCKTKGIDYPTGVPHDITKVLELDVKLFLCR